MAKNLAELCSGVLWKTEATSVILQFVGHPACGYGILLLP